MDEAPEPAVFGGGAQGSTLLGGVVGRFGGVGVRDATPLSTVPAANTGAREGGASVLIVGDSMLYFLTCSLFASRLSN